MPDRKKVFSPLLFLLILILSHLISEPLKPEAFKTKKNHTAYFFETWTVEEGLPQNSVLSLIQDRTGYIWLGTQSGLARFDGISFHVYNRWNTSMLKNDRITVLYENKKGVLWIGTDGGGLSSMENGKWHSYSTKNGLSNNYIRAIYEDREGNLWVGTANALNSLRDGKFEFFNAEDDPWGNSITAISPNYSGGLWIGTDDNGLYMVKDRKYRAIKGGDAISDKEITSLCEDKTGCLWIGTENGLYFMKNGKIQSPAHRDHPITGSSIRTLMEDSSGSLWIGTDGEGIYRLQNGQFTLIPTQLGLGDDFIYSFLKDREANLWVGTYTSGLARLTQARVTNITKKNGLPQDLIRTLLEDRNGHLWVGTDRKGVVKLKDNKIIEYFTSGGVETGKKISGNRITSIYQDREDNLWIGTRKRGITRIEKGTYSVYSTQDGLSSNEITVISGDSTGTIWIGTSSGLNRFENNRFITLNKKSGVLHPSLHIRTITEDYHHNIWVGTQQGLLQVKENHLKEFLTKNEKKVEYDILSLYADESGVLWIGTNGSGLIRLKDGKLTFYTTDSGLTDNYIFSILEDNQENLWMSSYKGVFRVSKDRMDALARNRIHTLTPICFDENDGMKSSECVMGGQPSAWKTSDYKFCFPTINGVAVFDPSSIKINQILPKVVIEDVFIDNRSVKIKKKAVFVPEKKIIEFYFTALSFTAPEKVRIRYKLVGFDTQWKDVVPGKKRAALYLNLNRGDYHFKVIACNNDGLWNNKGASFEFKIKSYFYKQPIFYFSTIIAMLVTVFGISWFLYRKKYKSPGKSKKDEQKYKTSALLPETVDKVLPRLMLMMEKEKMFLNADLTLKELSQRLQIHYNYLSQIINEQLNQSFNDFINKYRIEEAKKMLADPKENKKTVLEIAYETGFYSKSVFNSAFKKFTGMIPSQYRKNVSSRKKDIG